jgi:hypothetical protein
VTEQMALLRSYYPAAEDAKVVEAQVVKLPKATFSQVVGMDSLRPPQRTSVPSVVLAGTGPPTTGRRPWRAPYRAPRRPLTCCSTNPPDDDGSPDTPHVPGEHYSGLRIR